MKFSLKKLLVEGFDFEINLEAIFRWALIAYLVFAPAATKEQTKLPDDVKPEIKINEQISTTEQKKPNARRSKSTRKAVDERF